MRQQSKPKDLSGKRGQSRQCDRQINRPSFSKLLLGDYLRLLVRSFRSRGLIRSSPCEKKAEQGNRNIDTDGDKGGDGHVIKTQQIEAGQQAASDGACDVSPIEESE